MSLSVSTIYIDTAGDGRADEICGGMKYGLVHGEKRAGL